MKNESNIINFNDYTDDRERQILEHDGVQYHIQKLYNQYGDLELVKIHKAINLKGDDDEQ
jgi:hypothetical protein